MQLLKHVASNCCHAGETGCIRLRKVLPKVKHRLHLQLFTALTIERSTCCYAGQTATPSHVNAASRLTDTSEMPAQVSTENSGIMLTDRVVSRSQSLPQESLQPQDHSQDGLANETERSKVPEQPVSPPPNTLWGTPRASAR